MRDDIGQRPCLVCVLLVELKDAEAVVGVAMPASGPNNASDIDYCRQSVTVCDNVEGAQVAGCDDSRVDARVDSLVAELAHAVEGVAGENRGAAVDEHHTIRRVCSEGNSRRRQQRGCVAGEERELP